MVGLIQDPFLETADTDVSNNAWPRKMAPSRVELFKSERAGANDLMKDFATKLKARDAQPATQEAP